jgi:uncharacterized protein (TIGR00369 family)
MVLKSNIFNMKRDVMQNPSPYKKLSGSSGHKCFGCSPINPHGLQMSFSGNGTAVTSRVLVPAHMCGWNRLVHGGILSVILDEIMSWSVLHVFKKIVLTKSMTVDFLRPASISEALLAKGTPVRIIGRNEVLVKGEIYDSNENLCAEATGNFALLKPQVAKRLGIVDDDGLKGIEKMIAGSSAE